MRAGLAGDDATLVALRLERAFKVWPASGQKLAISYPAAPTPGATTIYMVDMPNKPQSQLVLARTLPPQYSPEMARIDVMDAILGGLFQSRLNSDIREVHGWSYGFNSFPTWQKGPGAERAQGAGGRLHQRGPRARLDRDGSRGLDR